MSSSESDASDYKFPPRSVKAVRTRQPTAREIERDKKMEQLLSRLATGEERCPVSPTPPAATHTPMEPQGPSSATKQRIQSSKGKKIVDPRRAATRRHNYWLHQNALLEVDPAAIPSAGNLQQRHQPTKGSHAMQQHHGRKRGRE